MSEPTYKNIRELRVALQEMIDAEYATESSGDSGHYDVSALSHVMKAEKALEDTEHVSRVELEISIGEGQMFALNKKMKAEGYESINQTIEAVINVGCDL
ncbi:MAG: hypothetical protein HRT93_03280 [Piscirickettsiaceae bacterium]|nr:hypothetical protein [Piscirickettsiaceae bacterium]